MLSEQPAVMQCCFIWWQFVCSQVRYSHCIVMCKDVEKVLSELFKSAEVQDRGEKKPSESPSDSKSYRRQLTVEELFKGEVNILVFIMSSVSIVG